MTETAVENEPGEQVRQAPRRAVSDEQLDRDAGGPGPSEGLQLTGEGGLLQQLTKRVLESALEGEITDHLGYDKHDPAGRDSGNTRNGHRAKTVLTDVGPVEVDGAARPRTARFEPQIVRKRQRRLSGVDEMVLSLSAKGLTTRGDRRAPGRGLRRRGVQADHLHDHRQGHGRAWPSGRTGRSTAVYPVMFIDAINVKIRDGKVANRPIYVAHGGHRRRAPRHPRALGRRRRRGRQVLAARAHRAEEPRRGRRAHGGLRRAQGPARRGRRPSGRARSSRPAWCTCCATLPVRRPPGLGRRSPRRSSRSTPRRPRPPRWSGSWSSPRPGAAKYPAIVRLWENAWAEFVPFLAFDAEIRKVICTTNAIESVNARIRRAVTGPRPLPERAGRAQVRLHGADEPRPDRQRPHDAGPSAGKQPSTPSRSPSKAASPRPTTDHLNNQDQPLS